MARAARSFISYTGHELLRYGLRAVGYCYDTPVTRYEPGSTTHLLRATSFGAIFVYCYGYGLRME